MTIDPNHVRAGLALDRDVQQLRRQFEDGGWDVAYDLEAGTLVVKDPGGAGAPCGLLKGQEIYRALRKGVPSSPWIVRHDTRFIVERLTLGGA